MAEYLSAAWLGRAKARAEAGEEPWAEGLQQLRRSADDALSQPLLSVRDNGGSPFFKQDAVYLEGRDGVVDERSNRKSGGMARRLSSVVYELALAYRMFGDDRYAARALELVHAWCINTASRMYPTGGVLDAHTPGGRHGGDIIAYIGFADLFLGCYLLRDCPGWALRSQAAVKHWIGQMVDAQRRPIFHEGREMYNNWEDARLLYLLSGALATGDLDLMCYVFDRWKIILPMKMTEEGELPRETMRTRSMHYTLFALDSTTQVAEVGEQFGVELYDYEVNGRCLRRAVGYATKYLLDMAAWPHTMIQPMAPGGGDAAHMGLFELAYARWGDGRYLEAIGRYGKRPLAARHATLIFGAAQAS